MNGKIAASVLAVIILASALCVPLALKEPYGSVQTGSAESPLDSLTADASDCLGKTFYVTAGGDVQINTTDLYNVEITPSESECGLHLLGTTVEGYVAGTETITIEALQVTNDESSEVQFWIVPVGGTPVSIKHTVTVTASPTAGGTVDGQSSVTFQADDGAGVYTYLDGQNHAVDIGDRTVVAEANAGYYFVEWRFDGLSGVDDTVVRDLAVTARFAKTTLTDEDYGTQSDPLVSLDRTTVETYGGDFYVAVGGSVRVTENYNLDITAVTSGFGLSVGAEGLTGTLGKEGVAEVTVSNDGSTAGSFRIHAIGNGGQGQPPEFGSLDSPLSSLSTNAVEAMGETYYIAVGGTVEITSFIASPRIDVGNVSEGYGLTVTDGTLAGTISKAGTIVASILEDGRNFDTFTIIAVEIGSSGGGSIETGSADSPLSSLTVNADDAGGRTFYVAVGGQVSVTNVDDGNVALWFNSVSPLNGLSATSSGISGTIATAGEMTLSGFMEVNGNSEPLTATIVGVQQGAYIAFYNSDGSVLYGTQAGAGSGFTTIDFQNPTSSGLTFVGWRTTPVSDSLPYDYDYINGSQVVAQQGGFKLYALFTASQHSVTVSASPTAGGTVNGAATVSAVVADQGSVKAGTSSDGYPTATVGGRLFKAMANDGYHFSKWLYDGSETRPTRVTGDIAVTAVFAQNAPSSHTVTFTEGTGGSVTPESVTVSHGSTISVNGNSLTVGGVTVTATASNGYTFSGWSVADGAAVNSDMTINASFSQNGGTGATRYVTFMVGTGGGGSLTGFTDNPTPVADGAAISASGSTITVGGTTVRAVANSGYHFSHWSQTSGTVTGNLTIQAFFTPDSPATHTVTISAGAGGTVSRNSVSVAHGSTVTVNSNGTLTLGGVTVSANPSNGYTFSGWSVADGTVVNDAMTVTASFSQGEAGKHAVTFTVSPAGGGQTSEARLEVSHGAAVTVNGNQLAIEGALNAVAAMPKPGCTFSMWTVGGQQVPSGYRIVEDVVFTATFTGTPVTPTTSVSVFAEDNVTAVLNEDSTVSFTVQPGGATVRASTVGDWAAGLTVSGPKVLFKPVQEGDYTLTLTGTADGYSAGYKTVSVHVVGMLRFTNEPTAAFNVTEADL